MGKETNRDKTAGLQVFGILSVPSATPRPEAPPKVQSINAENVPIHAVSLCVRFGGPGGQGGFLFFDWTHTSGSRDVIADFIRDDRSDRYLTPTNVAGGVRDGPGWHRCLVDLVSDRDDYPVPGQGGPAV